MAGGVATPGGVVARGVAKGAGVARTALRGAAAGAAGGAAYGAGEADELENVPGSAIRGGLLGGAVGGVVGGAAGAVGRAARFARDPLKGAEAEAGSTISARLKSGAGVQGEAAPVRAAATGRAKAVYRELDTITELDSPGLRSTLSNKDVARLASVPDDVAAGTRAPSFQEAQSAHQRVSKMRDRAQNAADMDSFQRAAEMEREIFTALDEATQGRYSQAAPEYAREIQSVRAVVQGQRLAGKAADEIEAAYRALPDDAQRAAFREGLASRYVQSLESGSTETFLKRADTPQFRRKLAIVFDGREAELNQFLADLSDAHPGSRAAAIETLRGYGKWFAGAAGLGAGGAGVISIFK
jgi:hypothetical protein